MTTHDPLCRHDRFGASLPEWCECDLIARVRADERERLRAQVARLDLLDIREDGVRGTTLVVRLDDVEALLGGESDG